MFKKLFNYMFPWAKQLVFDVHWAESNLRAETVSHSFLNPDSPTHSTESTHEMTAFVLPLTLFHPSEICQIHLLKDIYLPDCLSYPLFLP